MTSVNIKDAFFTKENTDGISYWWWSTDWYSKIPWTYNGKRVKYFYDIQEYTKDVIKMEFVFFGPLCIAKTSFVEGAQDKARAYWEKHRAYDEPSWNSIPFGRKAALVLRNYPDC